MAGKARHGTPDGRADQAAVEAPAGARVADADSAGVTSYVLLDEAALVERAKTDPDAFAALYERHVRAVYAFALSRVRDSSVAEDITSQTFLRVLHALPRYEQRGAPFKSWLFRIVANMVTDRHRSPHARAEVPLQRQPDDGEPDEGMNMVDLRAEEEITAWERAEAFAKLIADLTTEQRTVVQLRFVDGLPIAGIAAHMSRSEGAVKMLLMRALQHLRRTTTLETCDAG